MESGGESGLVGYQTAILDARNRVAIPARLRHQCEASDGDRLVLTSHPRGFLVLYMRPEFARIIEKIRATGLGGPKEKERAEAIERTVRVEACEVEVDGQGRILVPERLKQKADLVKEVVFTGLGHRMEIWARGRWDAGQPERDGTYEQEAPAFL